MCCTFSKSEMSNTRLYVGEAEKDGTHVHVLAYQNTAESNEPNAMVLPFPTKVKMGRDNVIDTSLFKNFLVDITEASRQRRFERRRRMTLGSYDAVAAQVFDSGSYTIVLADDVKQIPEALQRVSEDRRPQVSSSFLSGYGTLYPDQPIAVCCWNGALQAEPLLWWYEPSDSKRLFIPTMDAHDGLAPRLGTKVQTDHTISVGSVGPIKGDSVRYSDDLTSNVRELLPTHVHGHKLQGSMLNGDCFVKTADLHVDRDPLYRGVGEVMLDRGYGTRINYTHDMDGWS